METMKRTAELDRLSFTILAIEASAKKLGITPAEMRRRLERAGLIKKSHRGLLRHAAHREP